jgi:hypothetical protein
MRPMRRPVSRPGGPCRAPGRINHHDSGKEMGL